MGSGRREGGERGRGGDLGEREGGWGRERVGREGGEEGGEGREEGGEGRGGEGREGRGGMTVIHIVKGMFTSNPMIPQYLNKQSDVNRRSTI